MKIDLSRFVPLGLDAQKEKQWIFLGWGVSAIAALINFANHYTDALSRLYNHMLGGRRLLRGAVIAPFSELVLGCEFGFVLMCLAMFLLGVYHYHYHSRESKAIYLMRRLPSAWELHIRCLGMPVTGAVGSMAILGLLTIVFFFIYRTCTPAQCLPY